jgi:hypothetical protein
MAKKLKWRQLSADRQEEIDEWLENHHPWDYDAVYSLYHALADRGDLGAYVCRGTKKGLRLTSTVGVGMDDAAEGVGEELLLSLAEQAAVLEHIERRYCEGMEIEGFYLFHRAKFLKGAL